MLARVLIALFLPALGIVVAAGASELLVRGLPALSTSSLGSLSAGSYVGVLCEFGVAVAIGTWLCRRARSRLELAICAVVPLAWACTVFFGVVRQGGTTNWGSQLVWALILSAITPACGVSVGWLLFSKMGQQRRVGDA